MNIRKSLAIVLLLGTAAILAGPSCAPTSLPEVKDKIATIKDKEIVVEKIETPPNEVKVADSRLRVEAALDHVRSRQLQTDNAFWTIFHGILGLGYKNVTLKHPETGEKVNALDYIAKGGEVRGCTFLPTKFGLNVQTFGNGVGQGHDDQFIAEMTQWNLPADTPFVVFGKEYTFMDFVRHAQMRARTDGKQELSWTILVVGHYLGTDCEWEYVDEKMKKHKLTFDDLLRAELNLEVEKAPCGGTHSLFGLSWVYHLHLKRGGKPGPLWDELVAKTAKYRDLAKKYQNADGSFSTSFFRDRGNADDKHLRIYSTGHTFEWLTLALTDAEIREPWMENAANALALMILDQQDMGIEGGALYHAVHGLLIYHARLYDPRSLESDIPVELLPTKAVVGNPKK